MPKQVRLKELKHRPTSVAQLMTVCNSDTLLTRSSSPLKLRRESNKIIRSNSEDEDSTLSFNCSSLYGLSSNRSLSIKSQTDSDEENSLFSRSVEQGRLKSLLLEVKKRAVKDLPPPEFVSKFEELPDVRRRRSRKKRERERERLEVMGCNQSIDTILAKADRLIRRQQQVVREREKVCIERAKHISNLIESKGQRFSTSLQKQTSQFFLLKAISLSLFLRGVKPLFEFLVKRHSRRSDQSLASQSVVQRIRNWHHRAHSRKYILLYVTIAPHKIRFVLFIRIFRKRRAARMIGHNLSEAKDNEIMRGRVKHVLRCVRLLQRVGRDFIMCMRARVRSLSVLMEKVERKFVRDMLRRRKEMKWIGGKSSLSEIHLDNRTLNEMNKQDRIWDAMDAKMEQILTVHRKQGLLQKQSEEVEIDKHLLPPHVTLEIIYNLIAQKRQEHLLKRREAYKKIVVKKQFDAEDALAMLRGEEGVLHMAMQLLKPKKFADFVPFFMFKFLRHTDLVDALRQAHELYETFVVRKSERDRDREKESNSLRKTLSKHNHKKN
mmetsp:Transcript_36592/g.37261  ORF Transcript_36592/g.37261 Transcript_36592/m.37261 type:complete len:549 (-) Transcript_36592:157-1803(-)